MTTCEECGRHLATCLGLHNELKKFEVNCFRPMGTILIWDEMEFYTGELGDELVEYFRKVGV